MRKYSTLVKSLTTKFVDRKHNSKEDELSKVIAESRSGGMVGASTTEQGLRTIRWHHSSNTSMMGFYQMTRTQIKKSEPLQLDM